MNRIEATHSQSPAVKEGSVPDVSNCPVVFVNIINPGDVDQQHNLPCKRLGKRKSCLTSKDEFVGCPCNREHATDEGLRPAKRRKRAEPDPVDSEGNTPLCLAIKAGQLIRAGELIEAGADIMHINNEGNNVLLLAAQHGHQQFLDWSELSEVNLHYVNHNGDNALMLAAANGHYDILRWLTVMGISSCQCNNNGDNVLALAASGGHLQAVQWLLEGATAHITAPLAIDKDNYCGNTALMLAAGNGHLDVVQLLVKHHARIAVFNHQQSDALALAVLGGHLETAKWLVSRQLDIHQCYWDNSNLFHYAGVCGDLAIAKWLQGMSVSCDMPNRVGLTTLALAARYGHLELVTWLLAEKLSSIDRRTVQGDCPMHLAAQYGHLEVVQLLIASGQDVNQSNNRGQSALTLAASVNEPLALWLCDNGANIHQVDGKGNNAFLLGAKRGFVELLQRLAQLGADIHLINNKGDNAFTLAAKSGSVDLLRWLSEKQVNIHEVNQEHFNALTRAACTGCLPVVELLCSLGVDRSQCAMVHSSGNSSLLFGLNALALAIIHGHLDLADRLCQIFTLNRNNCGPLLLAAENGQLAGIRWWYRHVVGAEDIKLPSLYPELSFALLLAAAKGHLPVIKWLNERGALINTVTRYGDTALLLAANSGDLACVKWLYQNGGDIHHVNNEGNNALSLAAISGNLLIVQWLIGKQVANRRNSKGHDAVALATIHGSEPVIRWLAQSQDLHQCDYRGNNLLLLSLCHGHAQLSIRFAYSGLDIHSVNQDGDNALLLAAKAGFLFMAVWLCEQHVDVHWVNHAGNNALMLAAEAGHLSLVRWLYENKGVTISLVNRDGYSVLDLAAMNGHLQVVQWLEDKPLMLSASTVDKAVISAARNGRTAMLQWFWQKHFPLESEGESAFLCAVEANNLPLVEWCLARGCGTVLSDSYQSCFAMACKHGNLSMLRRLCQHVGGVAVANALTRVPQSMMAAAAENGRLHIMKWLVTQDLNPLVPHFADDVEPIYFAVDRGHLHIVKWLHELGAPLNHIGEGGGSLMLTAIASGQLPVAQWLWQQGVAPHEVSHNGVDALGLAITKSHGDLALWLLRLGCILTSEHIEDASRVKNLGLIGILYEALPVAGRAEFVGRLHLEHKRCLLWALGMRRAGGISEEKADAAIARYGTFGSNSLRQQSMHAVAKIIRSKNASWATTTDSLRRLPLLPILKKELHELLEARFFP